MKKTFIALALAGMACTAPAQRKCHITGHLDGVASDSLYIVLIDENYIARERIDTVPFRNGDIDYSIDCDKMRKLYIAPMRGDLRVSMSLGYMQVLAMPGEEAVIKGSPAEYFFSGSKFYEDFNEYDRLTTPLNSQMAALRQEYMKRMEAKEDAATVRKDINARYDSLQSQILEAGKAFVKAHPSSHVSGYLLTQIPAEERAAYAALLSDEVKNGPTASYLRCVERQEQADKERKEAAKKIQPGNAAPDFTLNDINGKPLSLSSLRGKTVVLDFWGSWCVWCIKGMPEMKKYYEKYKAKGLEILGIDCRDTQARWKAAVEKHALPWLHVYNDRGSDVTTKYAIGGYPTKIVVDKDGIITKVVAGEDPEFYTYLDELFK